MIIDALKGVRLVFFTGRLAPFRFYFKSNRPYPKEA